VVDDLAARADKLAESNRQLAAAMKDPAYAAGQKRLLDLERERLRLAKEGQRIAADARFGAGGGAGQAAGQRVAEAGGGKFTQIAAGAAAGGASGAVAAAGGPLALAIAAKEASAKVQQMAVDFVNAGGRAAASLAEPGQGLGKIAGAADAAGEAVGKLGGAGGAAEGAIKTAAAGVRAFSDTVDAFVRRGRELASYNGNLASSSARQDNARLMADVREANETGPELSRLTDSMTDIEMLIREGLLPIKKFVIEVLADFVQFLKDAVLQMLNVLKEPSVFTPDWLEEWAKKVLKALEQTDAPDSLIQDWINAADGLGSMPTIPNGAARDPGMGLPVFTR